MADLSVNDEMEVTTAASVSKISREFSRWFVENTEYIYGYS
jgi:hypothetical protein